MIAKHLMSELKLRPPKFRSFSTNSEVVPLTLTKKSTAKTKELPVARELFVLASSDPAESRLSCGGGNYSTRWT